MINQGNLRDLIGAKTAWLLLSANDTAKQPKLKPMYVCMCVCIYIYIVWRHPFVSTQPSFGLTGPDIISDVA